MKYWDAVDQLYWTPGYVGMKSIPQRLWIRDGDRISVPAELVNASGPLYTRSRKQDEQRAWMGRQEEILNHVFDIAFSIAPDALVERCLCNPLGIVDHGPFETYGRELRHRFGWGVHENITQHDGFFVSPRSVVAIEMKLSSTSNREQIVKYASLLAWEELLSGRREGIGLLYIVRNEALLKHWERCGILGGAVDRFLIDHVDLTALPGRIQKLVSEHPDTVASVLDRMRVAAISWHQLQASLIEAASDLDAVRPGDQTLAKLIDGLVVQIEEHVPGSSIGIPEIERQV